ncbi:MAG TPA: hypothetical protein VMU84_20285, partial [Thermoanaerobaculia bacterium]|nr:hypothetical protein [Thermoanaerobaculia bacterium]
MLSAEDRNLATHLGALVYANPFLDERIEHEHQILGDGYIASQPFWSLVFDLQRKRNIDAIAAKCAELVARMDRNDPLREDVAIYLLYERYRDGFFDLIARGDAIERVEFYARFRADCEELLRDAIAPAHLFACFFQVRRAFHHIFDTIVGRSLSAAKLRAAIWQSVFTHDVRRYRRSLYARLGDVPTLITG